MRRHKELFVMLRKVQELKLHPTDRLSPISASVDSSSLLGRLLGVLNHPWAHGVICGIPRNVFDKVPHMLPCD